MAVTDRAFGAVPFYSMEHHQTSHPFLQRTPTSGIVDLSILGSPVSELGQINNLPMGSGLNSNGSHYMHNQFIVNPSYVGENGGLFLGVEAHNQNLSEIHSLPQITYISHPRRSRKHRRQEDNDDCPLKKRRVSASPTQSVFQGSQAPGIFTGGSGPPFWASSHSQVREADVRPPVADQPNAMMHPAPAEDMEEVAVESQSDAALRRLRDIESRLDLEDEDEDYDNSRDGHFPTLVMSDVLVEGFKKGLDESLTKKIVASINHPSMELVLWKPQPEFLVNKPPRVASSHKANKEATKKTQSTPVTPLLRKVNPSSADKPCTSGVDCDIDTMWNREEEEMEL
ncbi:coiled-coil domain-containing protein 117 [Phyllobates terribilis]|uniref:coiled-coil domain-containing protein 117 n=1 Tax=Phyllobates terribilis TaxID=111132 RepID=UPI003CCB2940